METSEKEVESVGDVFGRGKGVFEGEIRVCSMVGGKVSVNGANGGDLV